MRLPQEEIKKRLVRLSNLEGMYARQRVTIGRLKEENKALKLEVASLKAIVVAQQTTINDMKLQIEELRTMVFGKKKPPKQRNIVTTSVHPQKKYREHRIPTNDQRPAMIR